MDFAALPPEVNSGRMYAGAGSGPLLAAAGAWDQLAAELSTAAASYHQTVAELAGGSWHGPSSAAMSAAAAPYVQWMSTTAAQAEETASQARSAAAAFEAAFAATVPPPVIASNRSLLATLVATNFLGINTAAIAATEAHYAEMWAQDAAAMYAYAGASATATQVTPYTPAPQNTAPGAAAAQSAAANQAASTASTMAATPDMLTGIANGLNQVMGVLGSFPVAQVTATAGSAGPYGLLTAALEFLAAGILGNLAPLMSLALPATSLASATEGVGAGLGSTLAGSGTAVGGGVSAGIGEATMVGKMSVPPSWGAAPPIKLASAALPAAGLAGLPAAGIGGGGMLGGVPPIGPIGSVVNAPRNGEPGTRSRMRSAVLPAWAGKSGGDEAAGQARPVLASAGSGSRDEREEFERLRRELADVVMERDAAARLISEAIRS